MAFGPVMFLVFTLLCVAVRAQQNQSDNIIERGSSLFPTINPKSWKSPSGLFEFGFYPQGNNGFAVGIWIVGHPNNTIVWTAFRNDPPVSSNSTLEFTEYGGDLLLRTEEQEKRVAELSMPANSASLLDNGNFVLYGNNSIVIWESFKFPTDTILGGQNLSMGRSLESSVSIYDHSRGRFFLAMQTDGNLVAYPVNTSNQPEDSYWSSSTFGNIKLSLDHGGFLYLSGGSGLYPLANGSSSGNQKNIIYRATLDADGIFRLYSHNFDNNTSNMSPEWSSLQSKCDVNGFCGFNSYCSEIRTSAECICFTGFVFINPDMKFLGCSKGGLNKQVDCRNREELTSLYNITILNGIRLGGYPYSVISMNMDDCGKCCQQDCKCGVALYSTGICRKQNLPLKYGRLDESESAVALVKVSRLGNNSQFADNNPPIPMEPRVIRDDKKKLILILAISLSILTFLCCLIAISSFIFYRRRVHLYKKLSENTNLEEFVLRPYSYIELEKATDGFKEELGRDCFGAVYKGAISEGNKVVAVKRLEKIVEQGQREFQAEITIIGKTHHRNLVRLLGFCIEGSRKLLVYEYMNNGSLADLLFKIQRRPVWKERVRIALDVARGILYLHEECEAHIIHCDIKPQNILMDDSWTAKISDFGLARLLMPNQSGAIIGIRGSRGYSAPEWQNNASISAKVDVYSFGIVLLEIVCCRSNMEVNVSTADEVLLSTWVYKCFAAREIDKLVGDEEEVDMRTLERMVKVGLLCIQDDPTLRPSMKNVILMLEGIVDIPVPPSPAPFLLID